MYAYATSGHCHLSCNFAKTSRDDETKLMVHADFCSKAKVVDVELFFKCEWTDEKQKGAFVCILCTKSH